MNKSTGWLFTDSWKFAKCPRCGSEPDAQCRTPKGKNTQTHGERITAWQQHPDYKLENYQVKVINGGTY